MIPIASRTNAAARVPALACFTAFALAIAPGCNRSLHVPDLGGLYSRAAQGSERERNPVIVIPGILGSKLVQDGTGKVVWGAFGGDYADPSTPEGALLLSLPIEEGKPLDALTDDVHAAGALDRLKLTIFNIPIEAKAYAQILGSLGVGGYRDQQLAESGAVDYGEEHFTCFQFGFDWRRDLSETAARFHEFLLEKRAYVIAERAKRYGDTSGDVKFDIVAHSMGGLLLRYYLQHGPHSAGDEGPLPEITWEGARYIERAVLVGTPSAGSVDALLQLVTGSDFVPLNLVPHYSSVILGTYPGVYELLPRPRHAPVVDGTGGPDGAATLDFTQPELWERFQWGLLDPAEDETLRALLPDAPDRAARTRRLHAALDRPASLPPGLDLVLIAGDAEPTAARAIARGAGPTLEVLEYGPGDGRVLRSSALLDERVGQSWSPRLVTPIDWSRVMFIFRDHLGLTSDPAFTDNILYYLIEEPRRAMSVATARP